VATVSKPKSNQIILFNILTFPDFSGSASDITFELEGDDNVPVLRAYLNPCDGDPVEANVNLAECIGNDCGTLVFGEFL
jgi:hypothetical protein